ncbi:MAG: VanZ family protein [Planctomycetota bacterium]
MIEGLRRGLAWWEGRPVGARALVAAAWAGLIWWLSSRPMLGLGDGFAIAFAFNGGHLVLFGTLAGLCALALRARTASARWSAWALAVAWGILDEIHQRSVPGRSSSVFDVTTDACGAALVVQALAHLRTRARRGPVVLGALSLLALLSVLVATLE